MVTVGTITAVLALAVPGPVAVAVVPPLATYVSHTTISLPFSRMVTGTHRTATIFTVVERPGRPPVTIAAIGRVTLSGALRASLPLVVGSARVAVPEFLAPGRYTLTAAFAGTHTELPSSARASFTVVKANVIVQAVAAPAGAGASSRISVSVTGSPGTPTGDVSVVCGHQRSGHHGLTRGRATLTLPAGTPSGMLPCTATYSGDDDHFGGASAFTVTRVPSSPR